MSTAELRESGQHWQPPETKPLDEAMWQAWILKGRERDRRAEIARAKAVEWISILALLAVAGLWSRIAPYGVAVRFIVAAGAIAAMFRAVLVRQYASAVVFAGLAVLYNPLAAVFSLSGDWPRAFVAASAFPFAVSLAFRQRKQAANARA